MKNREEYTMQEDHSVSGYLKRQSTQTLLQILADPTYGNDPYYVSEIAQILEQRTQS
ncbi:MAG: hypothetical protein IKA63_01035 [Clostridia bacterium]|nr:hypothetical protein [Clostridia bacterium]